MDRLAFRLYGLLDAAHRAIGLPPEPLTNMLAAPEAELFEVSATGVLAFVGDYALVAWPDDEMRTASRNTYRLLGQRLKARGPTRHMVHPLNFRSVKLTRKIGATPVGYDEDGFVHYILLPENFPFYEDRRRGQEVAAAAAA